MNDQRLLSNFLRQSADAADRGTPKPNLPPPAASLFAKFGMTERLMRGATMSPLLALALASMTMAPQAGASETAVSAQDRPAITATVDVNAADQAMLRKIEAYRPMNIPDGCVVNALMFRDWCKKEYPSADIIPATLHGSTQGQAYHHEANILKVGKDFYLWETNYGLQKVRGPGKSAPAPKNMEEVFGQAEKMFFSAFNGTFADDGYGEANPAKIPSTQAPKGARLATYIYDAMKDNRPSMMMSYKGTDFVAFRDGRRVNVFNCSANNPGTRGATIGSVDQTPSAVGMIAKAFSGGDGHYKVTKGDITVDPVAQRLAAKPVVEAASAATHAETVDVSL